MGIKDELASERKDAMKTGDKPRLNVIRQIEAEVSTAKAAPGFSGEVGDALYLEVMGSYVKKMNKARKEYEAAGARGKEQADKLAYEVEYLSRWLPATLDEDATRQLVRTKIAELGVDDPKAAGRVIGEVMKSGAEVDGGLVNRLVREELGA